VRQDQLIAATAAADQLQQRDAEIAEAGAARQELERRVADAEAAFRNAEQRATADRLAAEQQASQRQAEFTARLSQETATREGLERSLTAARNKVVETGTALRDAERRHTANMTTASALFADQRVQYETRLAQFAAARDAVDGQLRAAEASLDRSQQGRAEEASAGSGRPAPRG